MSTIMSINNLKRKYGDRVHIILSFREINKLRFLFELKIKHFLNKGIDFILGNKFWKLKKYLYHRKKLVQVI